jgi:hypothetical protein
MTKEHKLYELSKELVYQMTGNYTEDLQDGDFQIAWTYLNKAMDFIHCCKSDSEQLKHDYLEIGKQVEIDLTFTEKHIGKIVSISKDKVKVENNDWTYEVSKQNIAKVF